MSNIDDAAAIVARRLGVSRDQAKNLVREHRIIQLAIQEVLEVADEKLHESIMEEINGPYGQG